MATAVETLDKLERRLTISLPLSDVQNEVEKRLKDRARTAKAPGFRPGKVPMKMVAAQYGYQIESDVLNDKIGRAFYEATNAANLKVAGFPRFEQKEGDVPEGQIAFNATFEVFPEVSLGELSSLELEKLTAEVSDVEIDKTIEILRKQRVHFHAKGESHEHGDGGADVSAQAGDRVTLDFEGKIDGEVFAGGAATDYAFVLGEGQMLEEFENAATGMKTGESKTFPLSFPEDYHGKDVAGKTAEFTITIKNVEWAHLPEINEDFAKSLGIPDGDLGKMRDDIRVNLEREVKARLRARNKDSVMDALIKIAEMDVPKALMEQEIGRMAEGARQDMAQRGMNVKDVNFPPELFAQQAERRVRLGLILSQLVKNADLQAKPEQVKAQVDDFSLSYEDPTEVVKYYYSDRRRLAEVEALVLEENVVNHVMSQAKITEKAIGFDELMGARA
ncbi:trigger factor [Massilia sp. W12]|uniref:trigger factor n=1 Tax=Massilia sp. W12 TaxID=3126507 RepID=UPI0030D3506C